jgi:hypothetical protein
MRLCGSVSSPENGNRAFRMTSQDATAHILCHLWHNRIPQSP